MLYNHWPGAFRLDHFHEEHLTLHLRAYGPSSGKPSHDLDSSNNSRTTAGSVATYCEGVTFQKTSTSQATGGASQQLKTIVHNTKGCLSVLILTPSMRWIYQHELPWVMSTPWVRCYGWSYAGYALYTGRNLHAHASIRCALGHKSVWGGASDPQNPGCYP